MYPNYSFLSEYAFVFFIIIIAIPIILLISKIIIIITFFKISKNIKNINKELKYNSQLNYNILKELQTNNGQIQYEDN